MKKEISSIDSIRSFPAFPVVLVTIEKNIITIAAFHLFSFEPPMIMIGINPNRYSYALLKKTKDFGINIPKIKMIDQVELCGSLSGSERDKYSECNFTPLSSKKINSFLIKECPVNIECKVIEEINLGGSHSWFIGSIEAAYIDEDFDKEESLLYWTKEYRTIGNVIYKRK